MKDPIMMSFHNFLEKLSEFKGQAQILKDGGVAIGPHRLCPIASVYAKYEELQPWDVSNGDASGYGIYGLGLHPQVVDSIIESADYAEAKPPMRGLMLEALGLEEGVES